MHRWFLFRTSLILVIVAIVRTFLLWQAGQDYSGTFLSFRLAFSILRCSSSSPQWNQRTERAFLNRKRNGAGRKWHERTTAQWSVVQERSLSASTG